jgi:hypothetical protein
MSRGFDGNRREDAVFCVLFFAFIVCAAFVLWGLRGGIR